MVGGCNTRVCACYVAHRECDPDLCTACGSYEVIERANALYRQKSGVIFKDDEKKLSCPLRAGCCQNSNMQARKNKRVLVSASRIHGWGAYLFRGAEKNELLYEYKGEVLSQDEAERRGKHYDKSNCSFLFNLNDDLVVDATRKGNKIKYANHSDMPNSYAKVVVVNGDHRIGYTVSAKFSPGKK